jgi:hypothetical protein
MLLFLSIISIIAEIERLKLTLISGVYRLKEQARNNLSNLYPLTPTLSRRERE